MKLTEHVKKYIEENIDMIDSMNTDSALKFLDDVYVNHPEDILCIMDVLCDTLALLPDIRKYVKAYENEIESAYKSVKSINILNICPRLITYWDCHNTTGHAGSDSYIIVEAPPGSKLHGLARGIYVPEIHNEVYWLDNGYITLWDVESAAFTLSIHNYKFSPSEFYKKEKLNKFINEYKNYIKELHDKVYLLGKSVNWKVTANTIVEKMSEFIKSTASEYGIHCFIKISDQKNTYLERNEFQLLVDLPTRTKINLNVIIPYDSDPKNIDVDSLMTNWKKNFEKYIKLNKHKF